MPKYRLSGHALDLASEEVLHEPRLPNGEWTRLGLSQHPVAAQNVVNMWDKATPDEKTEGEGWYESAHDVAVSMAQKYGLTTHQAAGIIAVYSPQTGWGTNLIRAATVMRTRKAIGGKGSGVMATTKQRENAQRILAGEDYDTILKGRKINNFAHLIENGGDLPGEKGRVVADRHAIGVTRGISLSEEQYGVDAPSSVKRYEMFSDAYREAADIISKKEGRPIAPHQVQAATWLARQRLNKTNNAGRGNTRGINDWNEWLQYAGKVGLGGGDAGTGYELSADAEFEPLSGEGDIELAAPQPEQPPAAAKVQTSVPVQQDTLVRDVAVVLAAGASIEVTMAGLRSLLAPLGVTDAALRAALGLASRGSAHRPNARLAGTGQRTAAGLTKEVRDHELFYRAQYLVAASQRIEGSLRHGETIHAALADESLNYRRHEQARKGRSKAAAQVVTASRVYGPLLGWYLNPLLNNDPECIAANGHNFYAEQGTAIGLPGSVHPQCGCYAGPPIQGAAMVNDVLGNVIRFGTRKHHLRSARKGA